MVSEQCPPGVWINVKPTRVIDDSISARNCRATFSSGRFSRARPDGSLQFARYAPERMIGTLRRKLLDRILIVNERPLRRILTVYLHHFNDARPHRTLGQLAPVQAETEPPNVINLASCQVHRRPILDGLTNEYHLAT
jgi:transposase InsO family protein